MSLGLRHGLFLAGVASLVALFSGIGCSAQSTNTFTSSAGGAGGAGTTGTLSATGSGGSPFTGPSGTGGDPNLTVASAGGGSSTGEGGMVPGVDPTNCADAATNHTYVGCDFWPTVVANNVWSIFDYAVIVANAGSTPADVTVTRGGATVATVTVQPNALQKIFLPWVADLKGPDADNCGSAAPLSATVKSAGGAYHLVASVPVTVYQFNALEYQGQGGPPGKDWSSCPGNTECPGEGSIGCFSFSNDASLLLPSTAMTGNYRITGQAGWPAADIGPYMAITGTKDGTTATVYLSGNAHVFAGGGVPATNAGGTFTVSLNAGDVVEVVADSSSDLSGSLVKATNPVQVITGLPCIQAPLGVAACDHIEESVFPAETLGKHYFVTAPTGPNGNVPGHIVRIYGNVDGTKLTYSNNKPAGAPATINAGQVVDLGVVTKDFEVVGTNEFAIGSFMLGGDVQDPLDPVASKGDPSQSLCTSLEQYRLKYIFLAPNDYDVSYVDVIQPSGTKVMLDGVLAPAATSITGTSYGVARVKLGAGNEGAHVLTADKPVGIQVMGYGSYTSYQYPGGLNLTTIAPPPPPPPPPN